MTINALIIAAAALGVEAGWQPLPEGGHEYTLQLEPRLLEVLKSQDIISEVPPNVEIRRYRITIGTGKLARVDGPQRPTRALADTATPASDEKVDSKPKANEPTVARDENPAAHDDPFQSPRTPTLAVQGSDERAPAALPAGRSKPLDDEKGAVKPASAEEHNAKKPELAGAVSGEPERPWTPLLTAGVLLCCSLGANLYLGWIAWEARNRYRAAMAKAPRPAAS
jgi:hypothetical protein